MIYKPPAESDYCDHDWQWLELAWGGEGWLAGWPFLAACNSGYVTDLSS